MFFINVHLKIFNKRHCVAFITGDGLASFNLLNFLV